MVTLAEWTPLLFVTAFQNSHHIRFIVVPKKTHIGCFLILTHFNVRFDRV